MRKFGIKGVYSELGDRNAWSSEGKLSGSEYSSSSGKTTLDPRELPNIPWEAGRAGPPQSDGSGGSQDSPYC